MEESNAPSSIAPAHNNSKQRTHRSREWERQRRLKFNEAISKLGELVKSINKANVTGGNSEDNTQYPKIEIVQKAIVCLANCAQEKTQLKAEILALEVKLEAIEKVKLNRRDVSLQVTIGVEKKCQRAKTGKLMSTKEKEKNSNEKIITASRKPKTRDKSPLKLPKLLPLSSIKKETIVMLPAAPYIFPQRPVLFPTVPPTLVLVDANVQAINRPTHIPVINKCSNDITKTTMVNVLPISAYSRPLSALKIKKSNAKPRNNSSKKITKRNTTENKESVDTIKDNTEVVNTVKTNEKPSPEIREKVDLNKDKANPDKANAQVSELDKKSNDASITNTDQTKTDVKTDLNEQNKSTNHFEKKSTSNNKPDTVASKCLDSVQASTESNNTKESELVLDIVNKPTELTSNLDNSKCNKISDDKTILPEEKVKANKLSNILDSSICENVVDGGNARLELAEEFLAASPTAAFLMSFPLVSGNRADSPAEEPQTTSVSKNNTQRHENTSQPVPYFEKLDSPNIKPKVTNKSENIPNIINKNIVQEKVQDTNKSAVPKTTLTLTSNVCNDNPFLNLPIQTNVTSSCTLTDSTFGLDFDCNLSKSVTTQPTNFVSSNNLFYKSDPLGTVKSTIYSTSSITSSHDFNNLGLYPCAVENYASKNKTDFNNSDEALMKINSSRLTYDIDLGWSHKGFDFVNCTTTTNTFHKDNILNTTATTYSTSYNPFNPDFHVPLVSSSNKKNVTSKPSSFPDPIPTFYTQSTTLWSEDIPNIYTYSNVSKTFSLKQQNCVPIDHVQPIINSKTNSTKQYDTKPMPENTSENILKTPTLPTQHMPDKFTKKSPNKMHINWMTSEIRPMQQPMNQSQAEIKQATKLPYVQQEHIAKKQTTNDNNYGPINMHHFPNQPHHEDIQVWPAPRPAGTTEISIEPPPINLPTLVGDLALGPHDRRKNELLNRVQPQTDLQNCSNFFSVTQLMNRTSENVHSRSNGPINESSKVTNSSKHLSTNGLNDSNRKINSRVENHPQLCYVFNDTKTTNSYDNMNQYTQNPQSKNKPNKTDKSPKVQKNSYSAEALIRGGCSQKLPDNSVKYLVPTQKYNDFNLTQDTGVAQVSHFPPMIDYSDNNYSGQQFSGTTLYNTTTNTISNSFYSNFMPGGTNLISSNYAGAPFTSDFAEYNQSAECNYTNHKYSDMKMRTNGTFQHEKETSYKSGTRRESAAKHKLECSKKDTNKKYQSKRAKLNHEVEEWNDSSHLWQNKNASKRHPNIMTEEPTYSNYVGNQMPTQYQPEYFNSNLVPSNGQNIGPNGDRSLSNFPVASRANFNLSALFPEITMKVQ